MCRHFGDRGREEKFSQTGYRDWKHLNHASLKHQNSKSHTFALDKLNNYRLSMSERGSIIHQLNNTDGREGEIIDRNREHIKVILDVLITCAKQEVPLRGNRENDEVKNAGNFLEFYRLVCRHDKATQERLDAIPSNAKMLSHEILNDLLDAACTLLLRRIKRELHEGSFYAILADECKDVSKKQLVAVCFRYVHMGTLRERAVGLVATDNMTAYAIAQKILEVVAPFELDPSLCGGVQAILKGTFQNAIYMHCHSHRLNLVLSAVARTSDSRSAAVTKVFTLFDVIVEVLAQYAEEGGQSEIEAQSLLQQIRTKKLIFLLVLFKQLFSKSDFTSKSLQSINTSVTDTVDLIENLKQELTDIRSGDSTFSNMLATTNKMMEDHDVENWDVPSLPRSRKLPGRFEGCIVTCTLGKSTRVRSDSDLRNISNTLIDCQLNELNTRFHSDTYGLMASAAILMSPSLDDTTLATIAKSLNDSGKRFHVTISESELEVFVQLIERKKKRGEHLKSLVEVMDICNEDVFPNIHAFLKALITLPMTSCTVERVFSSVNRIKTPNRSTMLTSRLMSLCLLTFERELTVTLDFDEIIDIFKSKPRRLLL
ncbi:hypothetical protein PO909_000385 [Leuciscus waleckii]